MSTVSDFFKDALSLIGILAENETPSAEQGATMLRVFNNMMHDLADKGIDLGFNPQTSTTDDLDIAEGSRETVTYLLAVKSAPYFEVEVPQLVSVIAQDGYTRLLRKAVYKDMKDRKSVV